jgi:hypothetical protein
MKPKKRILDKATVAEIAKKYSTRKEFQRGDKGAYNAGFKKDWLDDVCAHMRSATCGFNNGLPGKLYQIKFTLPNGDNLWKIGITNGELSIRLRSIGIPDYIHSEIVCVASFDDGPPVRRRPIPKKRKHRGVLRTLGVVYTSLWWSWLALCPTNRITSSTENGVYSPRRLIELSHPISRIFLLACAEMDAP